MPDGSSTLVAEAQTAPPVPPPAAAEEGRGVFTAGLVLYLLLQLAVVFIPIRLTPFPPYLEDAYSYIGKAVQMRRCFRQDCPALLDLRQQVETPAADADVNWQRAREYHRVLYLYHPLHSALLLGLHEIGLDWHRAINLLSIAGALAIAAGIAAFLHLLWGLAPAGIALALLAFAVFPGWHGIHWVVPSNFALGIGFLAWAAILRGGRLARWAPPALILAMLSMHSIGRIYAVATLLLQLALMDRRDRAAWLSLAAGAAGLALYLALPLLVSRPSFGFLPHTPPADWSWWGGLWGNLAGAWDAGGDWARRFGGGVGLLLLAGAGLAALDRARWPRVLACGVLFGGLAVASVGYVLPRYPAELFHRTWIPLAVLLAGAVGHAAWRWLGTTRQARRLRLAGAGPRWRDWLAGDFSRDRRRIWHGFLGAVLIYTLAANGAIGLAALFDKTAHMSRWRHLAVDFGQPARVLARLAPGERVLYTHPRPLYVYLSHGGLDHGAVHYPAIEGQQEERQWLAADRNIRYAVSPDKGYGGFLRLAPGGSLEVRSPVPRDWARALMLIDNSGGETGLELEIDGRPPLALTIPAKFKGWLALRAPGETRGQVLVLRRRGKGRLLAVRGFRTDGTSRLDWPWESGLVFIHQNPRERTTRPAGPPAAAEYVDSSEEKPVREVSFRAQDLLPDACRSLGVLEDSGGMVAMEVACDSAGAEPAAGGGPDRHGGDGGDVAVDGVMPAQMNRAQEDRQGE